MIMIVKEVRAKTILSKSKVFDYSVNPYVGCEHGCTYCYARFMKRYTGHREEWGEFVDAKVNAPGLLQVELKKRTMGRVWVSGTCDPYQPLEKKYELTKKCLEVLSQHGWPVTVQTKSSLVSRDVDLLKEINDMEVGLTITTADDDIRRVFEPRSPPISERLETLTKLRSAGIRTFAMVAPLLPGAEGLPALLRRRADYVLIDRMNYHYADWVFRKFKLQYAMSDEFFASKKRELAGAFEKENMPCQVLF
jgi:DNA repair photolyase